MQQTPKLDLTIDEHGKLTLNDIIRENVILNPSQYGYQHAAETVSNLLGIGAAMDLLLDSKPYLPMVIILNYGRINNHNVFWNGTFWAIFAIYKDQNGDYIAPYHKIFYPFTQDNKDWMYKNFSIRVVE